MDDQETAVFGPVAATKDAVNGTLTVIQARGWEDDQEAIRGQRDAAVWAFGPGGDRRAYCDYPAGGWSPSEGHDVFVFRVV